MRWLEWLFPIHRYLRLGRPVTWRAAMRAGAIGFALIALALFLAMSLEATDFSASARMGRGPVQAWWGTLSSYPPSPGIMGFSLGAPAFLLMGSSICIPGRGRGGFPKEGRTGWKDLASLVRRGGPAILRLALLAGPGIILTIIPLSIAEQMTNLLLYGKPGLSYLPTRYVVIGYMPPLIWVAVLAASGIQGARYIRWELEFQADNCRRCGYSLRGLTVPRCPECGTPFEPARLGQLTEGPDPAPARPAEPAGKERG